MQNVKLMKISPHSSQTLACTELSLYEFICAWRNEGEISANIIEGFIISNALQAFAPKTSIFHLHDGT
jgi:hypothetical protein